MILFLVKQDVLKLNVSVCYASRMTIMNGRDDLFEQKLSLSLIHLTVGLSFEVGVKRTAIHVLHDQVYLLVSVESLVELGNVRVAKLLNNFYLSFDSFPPVWFKKLEFLVNLASYFLLGLLVEADAHYCISTLTDPFSNDIVVKVIRGTALCPELVLLLR